MLQDPDQRIQRAGHMPLAKERATQIMRSLQIWSLMTMSLFGEDCCTLASCRNFFIC